MTAEALIRTARSYRGQREVARNSSPLIDHWLKGVGQPPGEPWCAAFVCACIFETEPGIGFLKSASAMRLLTRNPDRRISDPEVGALVVWDHGHGPDHAKLTDHSHCPGHVAIITDWIPESNTFYAIAGNTSADGKSREGTMVAEHSFSPSDSIAGYLRVTKARTA